MPKRQIKKSSLIPSPLADPVLNSIFADEESAGLAAESLIKAVLLEEGEGRVSGKVIKVTPQRTLTFPGERGCRIDIEVITDTHEVIIFEVQTYTDPDIIQRNLFEASRIYTKNSSSGTSITQMAKEMPAFIAINILTYNIRADNKDILQPFKTMYVKPPMREVLPKFSGYNIQLPGILTMKPDYESPLYCWLYPIYKAHIDGIAIQEVIDMYPQLRDYQEQDNGFTQFCNRYGFAAKDPDVLDEYYAWVRGQMRLHGEIKGGYLKGVRRERKRLKGVIEAKDAALAAKDAAKDAALAQKDEVLAQKDAALAALKAELDRLKANI